MIGTFGNKDMSQALAEYDSLISEYAGPISLTVGTTPIEAKVGTNPLLKRTEVMVYNISAVDVYWGFNNTVSISNGMPIPSGGMVIFKLNPGKDVRIWLVASANAETRICEIKS